MNKKNRYFARDDYPVVKLVYNDEKKGYDAYRIHLITGKILFDPKYVGKALGWFYPPGSDLHYDEINEEKYNEFVKKIQKRAKQKLPFYCIANERMIKVVLEKSRYSEHHLIRAIYEFDKLRKEFKRIGDSHLELVYGETEHRIRYISEKEFNKNVRRLS